MKRKKLILQRKTMEFLLYFRNHFIPHQGTLAMTATPIFAMSILFWSMIFPQYSFNEYTTDILSENISYNDLKDSNYCLEILKNAEYDFWFLGSK